ncbi:MAG TPA: hypothetical protein PKJ83_05010 [Cyclobacteriaceae bacterium]|nr:hypothetical protein [Cyclobacteriaceae bacterium]HPW60660.1 hypothetical protein [Cyclobacteriaceae bacterium]
MKFNSVKEYFLKLNNTGYQLMMVPLILFIYFYTQSYFLDSQPLIEPPMGDYLLLILIGLSVAVLAIVQIKSAKKANRIATEVGLGIKLEKLGTVLIARMVWKAAITLLMPIGLVVTGNQLFSVLFGITLAWFFLQWPTPGRVSELLKLRGDEREMVLSKGEAFK